MAANDDDDGQPGSALEMGESQQAVSRKLGGKPLVTIRYQQIYSLIFGTHRLLGGSPMQPQMKSNNPQTQRMFAVYAFQK